MTNHRPKPRHNGFGANGRRELASPFRRVTGTRAIADELGMSHRQTPEEP